MAQERESRESSDPSPPAAKSAAGRARAAALGLLLLAATLLAYWPAVHGRFLWDDDRHFSENPLMTRPGGLAGLWTERVLYYPLTSTTFWAARRLWGLNPAPYHLLNILLHAANALLLAGLLARLRVRGAWAAGFLFALHPVAAQSVAWMTELKNVQSGFFYLLALHGYLSYRTDRSYGFYAAALLCFLLALLSKTSTVTLPLALVIIELWRRGVNPQSSGAGEDARAPGNSAFRIPHSAFPLLPFFALAGLAGWLTVAFHRSMVSGGEWDETFAQRLILAAHGVWFYLGKLFYPVQLSFVYPRWTVDAHRPAQWLWVAAAGALGAFLWIYRARPWGRAALLALAYYVASLLPVLNFFRMYYTRYAYAADHWQYLALMGGVAWIAGGLDALAARGRMRITRALPLLAIVLLGALTWKQAWIYRDELRLWGDVLAKNPRAAIAYNNLGLHFIDRGQPAVAERVLAEGLRLNPDNAELLTIHGAALMELGRPAEALAALERALRLLPEDAAVLNEMGRALNALGRAGEAERIFARAIAAKPEGAEGYYNLARVLEAAGRKEEARATAARGLRAVPGHAGLIALSAELHTR